MNRASLENAWSSSCSDKPTGGVREHRHLCNKQPVIERGLRKPRLAQRLLPRNAPTSAFCLGMAVDSQTGRSEPRVPNNRARTTPSLSSRVVPNGISLRLQLLKLCQFFPIYFSLADPSPGPSESIRGKSGSSRTPVRIDALAHNSSEFGSPTGQ